jgi:hypothetical protein
MATGKGGAAQMTRRNGINGEFQQVVVRDGGGKDVTPHALISLKPSILQQAYVYEDTAPLVNKECKPSL